MKFDILNRFNGNIQFTAEIDCADDASRSVQVGLAVHWARKSGADLYGADLYGADLYGADLYGAKGIAPELCTPILMLLDQPGPTLRAYKLVNAKGGRRAIQRRPHL